MITVHTGTSNGNTLSNRITDIGLGFNDLIGSLPTHVKPCPFAGFDVSAPTEKTETLLGWSYDWSDKGSDPPPWSDWPDKTT